MQHVPERISVKPDDWHEPNNPFMHATCSDVFLFDYVYVREDLYLDLLRENNRLKERLEK